MKQSIILALDPGTTKTGMVLYDPSLQAVLEHQIVPNNNVLSTTRLWNSAHRIERIAVEMIASYGMPVGKDVFETCVWIGRFKVGLSWLCKDVPTENLRRVYRKDVKMHLCRNNRAKDPNIRQAILDRFPGIGGGKTPQIGTKTKPGPLYGLKSHLWAALGVALTAAAEWDDCETFPIT